MDDDLCPQSSTKQHAYEHIDFAVDEDGILYQTFLCRNCGHSLYIPMRGIKSAAWIVEEAKE